MENMADEVNIQNTFVAILKQLPILLNKSQLPIIKEEKTKALQTFSIKLEETLGKKFTPQQVQKKIQNMKTEVKKKTDCNAMGNQKIKRWEEEFLQLLDGESNSTISRIPGLPMESDSNNVINSDDQVDIKINIKEEPNGTLTQVKSECGGFETVFVSSHFAKDNDNEVDSNEICNTMQIKEEPHWSESTSHEIKQEMELPSPYADLKEPVSDTEVITGDVAAEEASRLYRESVYRSKHTVSCFYTNKISDENAWRDNDTDETSYLLSSGQTQIHEESPSTLKQRKLLQDGKKLLTCEVFKKSLTRLSNLNEHKSIHKSKRHYTCEICNKNFTHGSTMKQHKLIHEGTKPHTCEICNRSFTLASTLKEHKFIHEGIRPHVCEICNKAFTQSSQLKEHKLIHAGIKPHTCEICNKSFTHASSIRRHKLMHEGTKSHTCEICKKGFIQLSSLKRHKLSHKGIKPHICKICNKGFTHMSYLKNHKITHESTNLTVVKS